MVTNTTTNTANNSAAIPNNLTTGTVSTLVPWMNDATLTVCAANSMPAANHSLKRSLDTIRDHSLSSVADKRVKLEHDSAYEDYKMLPLVLNSSDLYSTNHNS
ncbi:unnamed protein product [Anisakis simplex]|uniref:Uncharacterized protein n=1 Tax=Anisakis simplex TaxID=6269 RepID=A0A3P6PAU9_ANISI|nr:unnamed protein product [Anisakis simplex]